MPSTRQFRSIGLLTVLAFCIIYYIYNGASDTHESEFYQRTKAALERKKTSHDRDQIFAEEKDRLGRVERLRKEHDAAVEKEGATKVSTSHSEAAVTQVVGGEERIKGQKPLKVPDTEKDGKVVHGAPEKDSDDGVAKIGNVRQQQQSLHKEGGAVTEGEDDDEDAAAKRKKKQEEAEVEAELTDILKKGPIIVFSKSYCPYSKKAKVCGMECRMNVCMLTLAFFLSLSLTARPPRSVLHHTCALCGRTGHTSSRTRSTKPSIQVYGTKNGAECVDQWPIDRRRRRHCGPARKWETDRHHYEHGR